jgi:hypothetical protein
LENFTENRGIICGDRLEQSIQTGPAKCNNGLLSGDAVQESQTIVVRGKDYLPLGGIVAAAALGVSLLCGVSVIGINDINNAVAIGTPTAGIVDFVISNMNTMIVETVQAFSQPEIMNTNTATLAPTITLTPKKTLVAFKTSASFPLATLFPQGQNSGPPPPGTSTYTPLPTPTTTPKPSIR